jgi:hypothetical protein
MAEAAVKEAPEPSPGELDEQATPVEAEESQTSSDEGEPKEDLLSVLEDAVKPKEAVEPEGADTESPAVEEENEVRADDVEDAAEVSDDSQESDDFDDVPFNKHPRFRQLIRERKEFKSQVEGLQDKAGQFDRVVDFMEQNNLSAEEMSEGIRIMALMKHDPAGAVDALKPHMDLLGKYTGEVLPEDIQHKLDEGYVDEGTAAELAKARAQVELANARQEQAQAYKSQASTRTIVDAVESWTEKTKSTDPDFSLKEKYIEDRVRSFVASRGQPRNAEEGIAMAKEAYDSVTTELRKFAGDQKRPVQPVGGGKVSGTPVPEPKSLIEAMQASVRR